MDILMIFIVAVWCFTCFLLGTFTERSRTKNKIIGLKNEYPPIPEAHNAGVGVVPQCTITLHTASNGQLLSVFVPKTSGTGYNSNSPYEDSELYLIPEGEKLSEAVTKLFLLKGLSKED